MFHFASVSNYFNFCPFIISFHSSQRLCWICCFLHFADISIHYIAVGYTTKVLCLCSCFYNGVSIFSWRGTIPLPFFVYTRRSKNDTTASWLNTCYYVKCIYRNYPFCSHASNVLIWSSNRPIKHFVCTGNSIPWILCMMALPLSSLFITSSLITELDI